MEGNRQLYQYIKDINHFYQESPELWEVDFSCAACPGRAGIPRRRAGCGWTRNFPARGRGSIIDFPLSNCTNSGIDTVGVLTQYKPLELNSYIGSGQPWDLDRLNGGVHILPPYMREGDKGTWFKGTANAIYQNIGFVDMYDPEYVVILSRPSSSRQSGRRSSSRRRPGTWG